MKTFIIRIKGDILSEKMAAECIESLPANLDPILIDAVTPETLDNYNLNWTYPYDGIQNLSDHDYHQEKQTYAITCPKTNLFLQPKFTKNPKRRMSCFVSHYLTWERIIEEDEMCMVCEHDVLFYAKTLFPIKEFEKSLYDPIAIMNPIGLSLMGDIYHEKLQKSNEKITNVPKIQEPIWWPNDKVPQGWPGASAYIMKPKGAKHMLKLTNEVGAWTPDLTMCHQLVPNIGASKIYFTKTQNEISYTAEMI